MIDLPEINGLSGAEYDPDLPAEQQSFEARFWAFMVRLLPHNEGLSICEHAINGGAVRYPRKVWEYGGVHYIELTEFTNNRYQPNFFARKSATAKIEKP